MIIKYTFYVSDVSTEVMTSDASFLCQYIMLVTSNMARNVSSTIILNTI